MAPASSDGSTPTLSMKLLVDTKAGRVLYAEARKDVVDFLFSLLTLPVGTIVKILSKDSMVGSIGNLYGSVEELDVTYVRSDHAKDALLAPVGGYDGGKLLQLPAPGQSVTKEFYRCNYNSYTECQTHLCKVSGTRCRSVHCSGTMTIKMTLVDPSSGSGAKEVAATSSTGFVQGVVTYTVMDDLKVAPMSTISGITLLNTFGITDIGMLQEKTVQLGYAEGLEILRVSLQSKNVLSDVYLGKKKQNV
ncbi:hypothetical protein EJB05_31548 [Eragrostis curvula]|uniref:DUF674 domain-containing protein n=1 Tax=Eragrostis curvula TaxID=38414 RepID=A0A5J9UEX1_9POAL|nr:hypothetical protein EJB05_31548 [Eragrostis curvula]